MAEFIVAIELGSSVFRGIAGKKNLDGSITVQALVKEDATQCIRKGVVNNIDKTATCLKNIVAKLSKTMKQNISHVYVGVGGQSVRSVRNVIVKDLPTETIVDGDIVDGLMDSNRGMDYPDLEILNVVTQEYKVGNQYVVDPVGIKGTRLEGNFLNIAQRKLFYSNLNEAFDKAGIAIILQAVEELLAEGAPHGKICLGFTPDEEIGEGASLFDIPGFGADFAYTVDGGDVGGIEYENFNAASCAIKVHGVNIHPGSAKNQMRNALLMAIEWNSMLPPAETPAHTCGYEGFYHLLSIEGHCEEGKLSYIIRDHDRQKFEQRKKFLADCVAKMNEKYGEGVFEITLTDQYYNMKEKIEPNMHVIDFVLKAMEETGVKPKVEPIRGGTDGAQLSYRGLPCPNIFAGGVNFHGPYEFVSIQVMEKAMQVVIKISELAAGYND